MATMTRDELAKRIAGMAVLRGVFKLRSGRTSHYYIDKYLFSTQPDILSELGRMFAERLPAETTRLAGAELGGVPLVAATALASGLSCVYIRNSAKGYGTAKRLEGILEAGDRVTIIEDVATTGGQALEAASVITDAGAKIEGVIAAIDRQEGARQTIEAAGYVFDVLFTVADLGVEPEG